MATGSSLGDISNKTVQAKSIKQLLGQTKDRNPALENAAGVRNRITTSRGRGDILFGGGGGVPNLISYQKPDGSTGTKIGWGNSFVDAHAAPPGVSSRGSGMRGTEGSYNTSSQPITAPAGPPGPPPGGGAPPPPMVPSHPPVTPGPGITPVKPGPGISAPAGPPIDSGAPAPPPLSVKTQAPPGYHYVYTPGPGIAGIDRQTLVKDGSDA